MLLDQCGGVAEAADLCRVGQPALSQYMSNVPECENKFMPADVIKQLERASGSRVMTEHFAANHGCVLVELPVSDPDPDWFKHLADTSSSFGDMVKEGGEGLEDLKLDDEEAERWLHVTECHLSRVAALQQTLKAKLERE